MPEFCTKYVGGKKSYDISEGNDYHISGFFFDCPTGGGGVVNPKSKKRMLVASKLK